ncbi:hypothetical protein ACFYVL_39470 [Streptomyces sp. NPDC004111]|uniref:hypothetical protein n=1 Tax=Streptomyces sp. NPDC004111 TaxID=3364690 RepID=UPI0036A06CFE
MGIAISTVLAVAASVVLVVNLTGGKGSDVVEGGRAAGADSSPGPDGGGRSAPPTGAKESPSASATTRPTGGTTPTPSATTGGSAGASGRPGGAGKGTDGARKPGGGGSIVTGDTPFSVATRPYVYENPCSQYFLVDSDPARVGPPPNEQDAPGWAAANGAVSADEQVVALTFQGRSRDTVVLEAMHVRVVKNEPPLTWNRYATGVGCGGQVDTKSFAVDLDAGRPVTAPTNGQRDFPYKVSEADPEVFYVKARTGTQSVSWYLEVEWSRGGQRGVQKVDDHGKPFRTSGSAGRPEYQYPPGASKWSRLES